MCFSLCGVPSPDSSFSSFISADQLPAAFQLRSPIYVEVSIRQPAPEPGLSLRVRDCFAYPTSRTSVWRLLYDGSAALSVIMRRDFLRPEGKTFGIQDGKQEITLEE